MNVLLVVCLAMQQTQQVDPVLQPDNFRGDYHLNVVPERKIQARYFIEQTIDAGGVVDWQGTFPSPPQYLTQPDAKVVEFRMGGRVVKPAVIRDGRLGRPLLNYHVVTSSVEQLKTMSLEVVVESTFCSVQLVPGKPEKPAPPLPRSERNAYTKDTPFYDFTSSSVRSFIKDHKLIREADESDIAFGWRALCAVRGALKYVNPMTPPLAFSATATAARCTGDCLSSNALFTAIMRRNKIPTKNIGGFHSPDNASVEAHRSGDSHSQTIFWAENVGWVPVDATAPVKEATKIENATAFGCNPGEMYYISEELEFQIPLLSNESPVEAPWFNVLLVGYNDMHLQVAHTWNGARTTRQSYTVKTTKKYNDSWRANLRVGNSVGN